MFIENARADVLLGGMGKVFKNAYFLFLNNISYVWPDFVKAHAFVWQIFNEIRKISHKVI